jgi:hypothetical protein
VRVVVDQAVDEMRVPVRLGAETLEAGDGAALSAEPVVALEALENSDLRVFDLA